MMSEERQKKYTVTIELTNGNKYVDMPEKSFRGFLAQLQEHVHDFIKVPETNGIYLNINHIVKVVAREMKVEDCI